MPIGQSVARRLVYKAYTTAAITPGAPPAQATDPANTGGQVLRHLPAPIANLSRSNFVTREKRTSRQAYSARLGGRRVPVEVPGELSPKTYQDPMAATLRGSWAAAISRSNTEFTNMTITGGGVTATVGASTWAAQGFRVGDVIVFTAMSVAGNNAVYTMITALAGTAATLYPPLADNTADTAFTVATVGRKVFAPLTSHVTTTWFLEIYDDIQDLADIVKQVRWGSMRIAAPAEGPVGITFGGLGRDYERLAGGSSPFFASPTAATTTNILDTNSGFLAINGAAQSVLTGLDLNVAPGVSGSSVAFSPYMPELYSGRLVPSGTLSGEFLDNTIPGYYDAETEFEVGMMFRDSGLAAADFISVYMPRVKLTSFEKSEQEDGSVRWTAGFVGLEKATTTGYDASCISFQDSLSA